jgi:hypothetical protein
VNGVVQFGRATALSWIDCKAIASRLRKRRAVGENVRRHHRYLRLDQFEGEAMLLQYLLVTPPVRSIKLGHAAATVFQPDEVDTVLETVERLQASIASDTDGLQGLQYFVRP